MYKNNSGFITKTKVNIKKVSVKPKSKCVKIRYYSYTGPLCEI